MSFLSSIVAVACFSVLGLPPGGEEASSLGKKESSALPAGVLARVDGRQVLIEDYQRYLFFAVGTSLLQQYIDRILVAEEAERLAISIPYEMVEKEAEKEMQEETRLFPKGREEYTAALKARGSAYEEKVQRVQNRVLERLMLDHCILKTREVTEEEVARKLEELKDVPPGENSPRARAEVVRTLKERPPTPEERKAYLEKLRRQGEILIAGRKGSEGF